MFVVVDGFFICFVFETFAGPPIVTVRSQFAIRSGQRRASASFSHKTIEKVRQLNSKINIILSRSSKTKIYMFVRELFINQNEIKNSESLFFVFVVFLRFVLSGFSVFFCGANALEKLARERC